MLFLYKSVLGRPVGELSGIERASRPAKLPVVLTREEARALVEAMDGTPRCMALLLYARPLPASLFPSAASAGLRIMECARLRTELLAEAFEWRVLAGYVGVPRGDAGHGERDAHPARFWVRGRRRFAVTRGVAGLVVSGQRGVRGGAGVRSGVTGMGARWTRLVFSGAGHGLVERVHGVARRVHELQKREHRVAERLHGWARRLHSLAKRVHRMSKQLHRMAKRLHRFEKRVHGWVKRLHGIMKQMHRFAERLHRWAPRAIAG